MYSPSEAFRASPLAGDDRRATGSSKFTYRHLSQLALFSTSCPLRVIAHVDLDAFYAQCEMVRLGVAEDQPLAVQQWQGLIAVNYPAREFGIGRHCTVTDAKKLCPDLISQHVATWREGDIKWAYRPDAAANVVTDKVSLDPYRLESRKILAVIKEYLPSGLQRVEKASIDEVFLDLSAQVHSVLLERYPELLLPPPYDDPTEKLPMPPTAVLDWQADALVDIEAAATNDEEKMAEAEDPDWDDVVMHIGSEVVRGVRAAVRQQLGYTCSAGVACNKMLSKLGSGHRKPNQQTVVRNRAVQHFLSGFKITKIRNLGGKLGEQVVETFGNDTVTALRDISIEQMKLKLGDDMGSWVFHTVRGIDATEVNSRTQIKSMLSAKSFRPTIKDMDQAFMWLRIFAADIFSRLVEEGVLEHRRRPKAMSLHHRKGGQTRSRSCPIHPGKTLDEESLFSLAQNLMTQIVSESWAWPCEHLSLSVAGFEEGIAGNMGIGAFLLRGEKAQASKSASRDTTTDSHQDSRPAEKRRRLETANVGIRRFFSKREPSPESAAESGVKSKASVGNETHIRDKGDPTQIMDILNNCTSDRARMRRFLPITPYQCSRCAVALESADALQSHQDWHFARELQEEEQQQRDGRVKLAFAGDQQQYVSAASAFGNKTAGIKTTPGPSTKKPGNQKKAEVGQSKLNFG